MMINKIKKNRIVRRLFQSKFQKELRLVETGKKTGLNIKNHFGITDLQILATTWFKGLWTGILISLIIHNCLSH